MLYFDHAATTLIYPEVLALLNENFRSDFANPSSSHSLGKKLSEKIEDTRMSFLKMLDANQDDKFIFTSSATESNNHIISRLPLKKGDIILYSKADHPSIVQPIENLIGKEVELISIKLLKNGHIDLLSLEKVLNEKTISLAAFSQVNHQSGNIYDVLALAKLVKEKSPLAHIHIDAVQAFGKIKTKVSKDISSMSLTAHKLGGPKGIAGLFLEKNHKVKALFLGGGQQGNLRAGTENFPLVNAFHEAAKVSILNVKLNFDKVEQLNNLVKKTIAKNIPSAQFLFEDTSPYILTFLIPGISTDIILRHLEVKNIFIGTTSACSGRIKAFNPTLEALGVPEKFHKNILRISFGMTSNQLDTDLFIHEFLATWTELQVFVK